MVEERKDSKELPKKLGDKGFLTLFIIMIPSLIIAMSASVPNNFIRIPIQVVVLLLQFVVVKSFIDDYQELKG